MFTIQNLFDQDIEAKLFEHLLSPTEFGDTIKKEDELPVITLQNNVLYPTTTVPMHIGQAKSIALLKMLKPKQPVVFVPLNSRGDNNDETNTNNLYDTGTYGYVLRSFEGTNGNYNIIAQGRERVHVNNVTQTNPYIKAKVTLLKNIEIPQKELQGYLHALKDMLKKIIELSPSIPNDTVGIVDEIQNLPFLLHLTSLNLSIALNEKVNILRENDLKKRTEMIMGFLSKELETLKLSTQIQSRTRTDLDKVQKEYYLRQQLKSIQDELGETTGTGGGDDISSLKKRLDEKKMKETDRVFLQKEIDKLTRSSSLSPDYNVNYNYLDFALSLPWQKYTEDNTDLYTSEKTLNEDHYGLEKIKERILEFIAVLRLKKELNGPILCFVGPPGVGKTSLGESIARALKRKFIRVSLGGVSDEAELRGHRRTYIGAMPGRILQGIKRAESSNPVILLDEVDKIGSNFRSDPAAALLEILDPAQNHTFSDHFLELGYDLSKTLFIATANTLDSIPPALVDRMELIPLNGYTDEEKIKIAERHLIPRQIKDHGLTSKQVKIPTSTLANIIDKYTREAGVRKLEQLIGKICRGIAKEVVYDTKVKVAVTVTTDKLEKYLGYEKNYKDEYTKQFSHGVSLGLAWTPVGGDVLFIETTLYSGTGKLVLTGQLGDVMKESAAAAMSYLKANREVFQIPLTAFQYWDVHIHIPQGAIPKDGPSAGITILTSLASAYTRQKVKSRLAMTGEITLRGEVLPVGGIKEKVLAAKRFGVTSVFLPKRNELDVKEITKSNQNIFKSLELTFVENMVQTVQNALEPKKKGAVSLDTIYPKPPEWNRGDTFVTR